MCAIGRPDGEPCAACLCFTACICRGSADVLRPSPAGFSVQQKLLLLLLHQRLEILLRGTCAILRMHR